MGYLMKINHKFNLEEAIKNPDLCPVCKKDGKKWIEDRWIKHKGKLKLHAIYTCIFCDSQVMDVLILETIKILGRAS